MMKATIEDDVEDEEVEDEATLVDDESVWDEDNDGVEKGNLLKRGKGTIRIVIRSRAFL
jgi:hypothetical protein